MKLLFSIRTGKKTVIEVWEDEKGRIVLGGLGWYEYNRYEKLFKKEG